MPFVALCSTACLSAHRRPSSAIVSIPTTPMTTGWVVKKARKSAKIELIPSMTLPRCIPSATPQAITRTSAAVPINRTTSSAISKNPLGCVHLFLLLSKCHGHNNGLSSDARIWRVSERQRSRNSIATDCPLIRSATSVVPAHTEIQATIGQCASDGEATPSANIRIIEAAISADGRSREGQIQRQSCMLRGATPQSRERGRSGGGSAFRSAARRENACYKPVVQGFHAPNNSTVRIHPVTEETPNHALSFNDGGSSSGGMLSNSRWTRRSGARKTIQSMAPTTAAPTQIAQTLGNVTPQINEAQSTRVREKTPNDGQVADCTTRSGNPVHSWSTVESVEAQSGYTNRDATDQPRDVPQMIRGALQCPAHLLQGVDQLLRLPFVHPRALQKSEEQTSHSSRRAASKDFPNWSLAA